MLALVLSYQKNPAVSYLFSYGLSINWCAYWIVPPVSRDWFHAGFPKKPGDSCRQLIYVPEFKVRDYV